MIMSDEKEDSKEEIHFWGEDPNALFDPKYILEFFPTSLMTYNQKLNAFPLNCYPSKETKLCSL